MKKSKVKFLTTYNGGNIKVDPDDYPVLKSLGDRFGWHIDKYGYPICNYKKDGKTISIRLHRFIMKRHKHKIKGLFIDHRNRNKLDNTKDNLRVVGYRTNNRNRSNVVNF
jgi:hypothetical protein